MGFRPKTNGGVLVDLGGDTVKGGRVFRSFSRICFAKIGGGGIGVGEICEDVNLEECF